MGGMEGNFNHVSAVEIGGGGGVPPWRQVQVTGLIPPCLLNDAEY
jgi:hypothetical protein